MSENRDRSPPTQTLTDPQQELLETAVERGYFKVPRETTLVELADAQGMSDVEASKQLREGLDIILCSHLDDGLRDGG